MADQLFVYGTLHPDHAPPEIANAVKMLTPLGHGTIRGKLYDLGDYPAVVLPNRRHRIPGSVFALPDDSETLPRLDEYEEFKPSDPDNSLFVRTKRTVTLDDGSRRRCWVYLYNRELPQAS